MNCLTIVGSAAALLTTIALFPQLVKLWKTKSARDISLASFSVFCLGVVLWLLYGIMLNDIPIIIANSICFVQALIIIVFKIRYK